MRIDVVMLISGVKGEALKKRQLSLAKYASPGTEVRLVTTKEAPLSVDSLPEMELAAPGILERVVRSEKEGADAVIIWGGHDPSLAAARNLVSIPVLAPGMASIYLASMLAEIFTLMIQMPHVMKIADRQIRDLGLWGRCSGIYSVDLPVLQLREPGSFEKVYVTAVKAVNEGAEAICFGCMAFNDHAEALEAKLNETHPGVIVIHPAMAVIRLAELFVGMGLTHSKRSYPYPPKDIQFPF
ncbi:MAG: aspartate/glutamate racemase family protein [Candidatus Bathyarchaeota archaeon]|nr:aspartate/glutamate racemase family protein [Candidatus Bathyarchaeota archaeon]